ncbi:hypothetical protein [Methanosarcina sp.]|uniref:hypothetical protein n=1 Tax=Methanosarcina sp. TaxID=2213 RepID=UPI002AB94260|nr:hypothetical protein [Methanosarcina sp.]MDY9925465.1 hypothetical protein [Methanosarcina sp.]
MLATNMLPLTVFGLISVGIEGVLTTIGFASLQSQTGSLLALIEPVAGVFFDLIFLGVALSTGTLTGCLLVLAAAVITSRPNCASPELRLARIAPRPNCASGVRGPFRYAAASLKRTNLQTNL